METSPTATAYTNLDQELHEAIHEVVEDNSDQNPHKQEHDGVMNSEQLQNAEENNMAFTEPGEISSDVSEPRKTEELVVDQEEKENPLTSAEDDDWLQAAWEAMGYDGDPSKTVAGEMEGNGLNTSALEDDQDLYGDAKYSLPDEDMIDEFPFDDVADTFIEHRDIPSVNKDQLGKLIHELASSEERYVDFLDTLLRVYVTPLEELDQVWKRKVLQRREIAATLCYIRQIRILSVELSSYMARRMGRIDSDSMDQEMANIALAREACLAVIRFASLFKLYGRYAATFYRSTQALIELEAQDLEFASFLRSSQAEARNQKLDALLIMPVQRLPRFQLFLKQVIGALEAEDGFETNAHLMEETSGIASRALTCVEDAIRYVDESVQDEKDYAAVVDLQGRLASDQIDVVSGFSEGRRLVRQGKLMKASQDGHKMEALYFVLLTDVLFYAELRHRDHKLRVRRELPKGSFTVSAAETEREEDYGYESKRFYIDFNSKRLDLFASSKEDRDAWVAALQTSLEAPKTYDELLEQQSKEKEDEEKKYRYDDHEKRQARKDSVERIGELDKHNDFDITATAAKKYERDLELESMIPQSEPVQMTAEAYNNEELRSHGSGMENHSQYLANVDVEIIDDASMVTAAMEMAARNKAAPPNLWDTSNDDIERAQATGARASIRKGPVILTETLIEGEQKYADQLAILLKVFVQPLLDISVGGHLKYDYDRDAMRKARSLLTETNVQVSLHSLVQLQILQEGIINIFETEWHNFEEHMKEAIPGALEWKQIPTFVPEVFETIIALLALYSSYTERYEAFIKTLQQETMEDLRRSLERNEDCRGKPMHVFLRDPISRPAYYAKLLKDFVASSEEYGSADLQDRLKECQAALQTLTTQVTDASTRHHETEELLRVEKSLAPAHKSWWSRLFGASTSTASKQQTSTQLSTSPAFGAHFGRNLPQIVKPSRRLLLEADLIKVCARGPKRRHFWLFNDLIMYAEQAKGGTFKYRYSIPTADCFAVAARDKLYIDEAPEAHINRVGSKDLSNYTSLLDDEDASLEQLATARSNSTPNPYFDLDVRALLIRSTTKSFVVICPSVMEKHRWVDAINKAASEQLRRPVPDKFKFYLPILYPVTMCEGKCGCCKMSVLSLAMAKRVPLSADLHCHVCGLAICGNCAIPYPVFLRNSVGQVCKSCREEVCRRDLQY